MTARRGLFLAAALFLVLAVANGYRVLDGIRQDFYWTPMPMALTPEQASHRVEIYVGDDRVRSSTFPRPVRIRLNNVADATRDQLALVALFLGAGVAFLISALVMRPPRGPVVTNPPP